MDTRWYSVKSAYQVQFTGSFSTFPTSIIWKAKTEQKCRFFAWLVMHDKVLTADNLAKRNWPHNESCSLCYCNQETTEHLLTNCNFTKAAWNLIADTYQLPKYHDLVGAGGPRRWITHLKKTGSNNTDKRKNVGILLYFWLHIWKDRNRRVFQGYELSTLRVTTLMQEDINLYGQAVHDAQN